MKKTTIIIAALAAWFNCQAAVTTFFGSMVTVNNTSSNSPALNVSVQVQPTGYAIVQHGALTATNNFYLVGQWSVDNTNFITCTSAWYPSSTNATSEYWYPNWTLPTNYFRAVATSTNSVQVGGAFVQ